MKKIKKKRGMIRNFAVVPICSYKRRHLRYDGQTIYSLLGRLGILQKGRNGKNIAVNRFTDNATRRNCWDREFNMGYIAKLGDRVQRPGSWRKKQFQYQFTTDGVACSPLYEKSTQVCEPDVLNSKYANRYIQYFLKIYLKSKLHASLLSLILVMRMENSNMR